MLLAYGKIVTREEFESSNTGKKYVRVGLVSDSSYTQVNSTQTMADLVEGIEACIRVEVAKNGSLWFKNLYKIQGLEKK